LVIEDNEFVDVDDIEDVDDDDDDNDGNGAIVDLVVNLGAFLEFFDGCTVVFAYIIAHHITSQNNFVIICENIKKY